MSMRLPTLENFELDLMEDLYQTFPFVFSYLSQVCYLKKYTLLSENGDIFIFI